MPTKTISIDTEAYSRLKTAKQPDESFSDVIKRLVPKPMSVEEWMKDVRELDLSKELVDAVESVIADRRSLRNLVKRRAAS